MVQLKATKQHEGMRLIIAVPYLAVKECIKLTMFNPTRKLLLIIGEGSCNYYYYYYTHSIPIIGN